jgi:hypothetical protein
MVRWNLTGEGTKAMLYARNIGNMKITDLNGGNGYSAVITPALILMLQIFILSRRVTVASDILSPRTIFFGKYGAYNRSAGTVTGFDLLANLAPSQM